METQIGTTWESRAIIRAIEPRNDANCAHCGAPVKFAPRKKHQQVIANVYEGGVWDRVEHYHVDCYTEAKEPYGPPARVEPVKYGQQPKRPIRS